MGSKRNSRDGSQAGRAPWYVTGGVVALTAATATAWVALPRDGDSSEAGAAAARVAADSLGRPVAGVDGNTDGAAHAQPVADGQPQAPTATKYTVALRSDESGRSWTGTEQIDFTNAGTVPITEFWIRLWGNGYDGCSGPGPLSFTGRNGQPAERISNLTGGTLAETAVDCTAMRVTLDQPLAAGANTRVAFDLSIGVPQRKDRFGSFNNASYLGNALAVLAVKDEHGWELAPYVRFGEPFYSLTADFDVTLDHPAALSTPSTGQTADEHTADGRTVTHIVAPKVRDFAWSIGAFHHDTTRSPNGVEVAAYWVDSESSSNVRNLMSYAARAVDAYSNRFGAYPYPRMTLVFADFGPAFDGMEYPNYMLSDAYAGAVAHEVAHQWWYGMIGDDQYRHPWLDEAFTEYAAEEFQGSTTPAHGCDFLSQTERMDQTMETYEATGDYMYHDAIYHEGTCLLFDMEHDLGRGKMDDMLRGLFARYRYGVLRPADVREAAQEAAGGKDMSAFWAKWRNLGE